MPMFVFIWPWVAAAAISAATAWYAYTQSEEEAEERRRQEEEARERQRELERAQAWEALIQEAHVWLAGLVQNHGAILNGQPCKLDLSGLKRFVREPRLPDAALGVHYSEAWCADARRIQTLADEIAALERFRDENRPDQPNEK